MVTVERDERRVSFECLKKFGMKCAVLTALVVDLRRRGARVPSEVNEQLKLTRMRIMSGCFWPCEVGCTLGQLEGQLVALGSSLGEDYLRPWFDLLAQAMEGRIDPGRISAIPALEPVADDCKVLACRCGELASRAAPVRPEASGGCR
jgi:hypothetical protein